MGAPWDEARNLEMLEAVAPRLDWPMLVAGAREHPAGGLMRSRALHLLGELPRAALAERLGRASLFVLPSREEPSGPAALGAALAGCALVLSDIPSFKEMWEDAAVFVPPEDTEMWGRALRRLVSEPVLRGRMSTLARTRALEFSPERMADAYVALYGRMGEVSQRSAPSSPSWHGRRRERIGAAPGFFEGEARVDTRLGGWWARERSGHAQPGTSDRLLWREPCLGVVERGLDVLPRDPPGPASARAPHHLLRASAPRPSAPARPVDAPLGARRGVPGGGHLGAGAVSGAGAGRGRGGEGQRRRFPRGVAQPPGAGAALGPHPGGVLGPGRAGDPGAPAARAGGLPAGARAALRSHPHPGWGRPGDVGLPGPGGTRLRTGVRRGGPGGALPGVHGSALR
ncbi:glycosyltransferase [Cystobacter fuscus]